MKGESSTSCFCCFLRLPQPSRPQVPCFWGSFTALTPLSRLGPWEFRRGNLLSGGGGPQMRARSSVLQAAAFTQELACPAGLYGDSNEPPCLPKGTWVTSPSASPVPPGDSAPPPTPVLACVSCLGSWLPSPTPGCEYM